MLTTIRKGIGSWFTKAFLGLIILSFAVWGVGDILRGPRDRTVLSVGGLDITISQFQNELRRMQAQLGPNIDFQRALALLPNSKTGRRRLLLPASAMEILNRLRRSRGFEWVFPGRGETGHLTEVRKTHDRACRFAGLAGLRVHDLRHSFASVAVTGGHGLPVVGEALGHKRASTTERYSHLAGGVVREMVEETGAHIADMMAGKEGRS